MVIELYNTISEDDDVPLPEHVDIRVQKVRADYIFLHQPTLKVMINLNPKLSPITSLQSHSWCHDVVKVAVCPVFNRKIRYFTRIHGVPMP